MIQNLRALRESASLSQQRLADAVGLTQQKIHAYETGAYEPDIQTLMALAAFFETSIDYLVGATDIRRKIEPTDQYALNAEEQAVIDRYRALDLQQRKLLLTFIEALELPQR